MAFGLSQFQHIMSNTFGTHIVITDLTVVARSTCVPEFGFTDVTGDMHKPVWISCMLESVAIWTSARSIVEPPLFAFWKSSLFFWTVDFFLLFIISSNHDPSCNIQTIMSPLSSAVVSLVYSSFHQIILIFPSWPSRDKFKDNYFFSFSPGLGSAIFKILSRPPWPPRAIQPSRWCHRTA